VANVNFLEINHPDPLINRIQLNIRKALERMAAEKIGNLYKVENIALTTTPQRVSHGLKQPPVGWIVARKSAGVDIWESSSSDDPATYVNIQASANVTATLLFF